MTALVKPTVWNLPPPLAGSRAAGKFRPWNLFWILCLAFGIFAALPQAANAATLYWVGGNGDNVGTNANDWSTTDPTACADGAGNASAVLNPGRYTQNTLC